MSCALALTLSLASAEASAQDNRSSAALAPDVLFARVASSVWVVQASDAEGRVLSTGSAVVTAPERAVTSCTLLAKASTLALKRDNVSYGATLEFPDVPRDLCQLRIPHLSSPVASIAPMGALQVGMPLYLIGSPRGKEMSLSVSMLSSLRRDAANDLEALQLAMPADAGLGGAGIFDAQGRLAGLVGTTPASATTANLAMPAAWISDLPTRGLRAIERFAMAPTPTPNVAVSPAPANPSRPSVVEYELHDRLTNVRRKVVYRADAIADGPLSFNNGGWVEKPGGEVIDITSAIAGEFDAAMPPGGWGKANLMSPVTWSVRYSSRAGGNKINMDLRATVMESTVLPVNGQQIKVVRIAYEGYTERFANDSTSSSNQSGRYRANVWFSPEVGRVVRFEVQTRGGASGGAFHVDEALALVSIR